MENGDGDGAGNSNGNSNGNMRWAGFSLLALAAFLVALSAVGLIAAQASIDGRAERGLARTPRFVAAHESEQPRALWAWQVDDIDGMPYDVVYLEPLVADAPLPPGLSRWPAPGEVFASKALLEAGRAQPVAEEYGRYAGAIAPAGLEAPGERFAYVRPATRLLDKGAMQPVSGFGESGTDGFTGLVGEHLHMPAVDDFYRAYALLVLLPVAVLAIGLARVGRAARRGPWSVAVPVAAGGAAAGVVALCAMTVDVPLPLVEFTLSARDFRQAWLLAAVAGSVGALSVLAAAVLPGGAGRMSARMARKVRAGRLALPGNGKKRGLWLFPFLLLLTVRGAELGPAEYRGIVQVGGSVALLATFPGVVRTLVEGLGRVMCRLGERMPRLGGPALLAGREIVAQPAVVSRPLSALAMAVVMAAQVQLWAGAVGDTTQGSLDSRRALSSSVLLVNPPASRTRTAAFERSLPGGALPMGLIVSGDGGRVEIVGSCAALRETGLCDERLPSSATGTRVGSVATDPRLRALLAALAPADAPVYARVADVPEALAGAGAAGDHGQLLLVGAGDRRLPVAALSRIAHRELAMKGSVRMIGDEWVWGAASKVTAGRWARLLSLIGLAAVATTVVLHLRRRRPWPGARWAAWWYVVPAGVTVMALAAVVAWWLAAPVNSVCVPGPVAMAIVLAPATLLMTAAALSRACAARPLPVSPEPRAEPEPATV